MPKFVCGQDCPDGDENDFRLVQCRDQFDSTDVNGTFHTWQPYFPGRWRSLYYAAICPSLARPALRLSHSNTTRK